MKFYHLTDLHYVSKKKLGENCWTKKQVPYQTSELLSEHIIDCAFDNIINERFADTIIVTGDITHHGDFDSHDEMVIRLKRLKENGFNVVVFPASHDFNQAVLKDGVTTENEAQDKYADFGLNQALSVYDKTNSFVIELSDNVRFFAINPIFGKDKLLSKDFLNWLKAQCIDAKQNGKTILASIHYPILCPTPLYKILGGEESFIVGHRELPGIFYDLGIKYIICGHTHIHDVSYIDVDNKRTFYQITTAALSGYPPFYRLIEINAETINFETKQVDFVDCPLGKIDVSTYTKEHFIGMSAIALDALEKNVSALSIIGAGIDDVISKLKPFNFLITRLVRKFNKLTFGKLARLTRRENKLKKAQYQSIKNDSVKDFFIECAARLYDGKQDIAPTNPKYIIFMSGIALIDSILRALHVNLKDKLNIEHLSELFSPILYNAGIDNLNGVINLAVKPMNKTVPPITSHKGGIIIFTIAFICLILSPIIIPWGLLTLINVKKEKHKREKLKISKSLKTCD